VPCSISTHVAASPCWVDQQLEAESKTQDAAPPRPPRGL